MGTSHTQTHTHIQTLTPWVHQKLSFYHSPLQSWNAMEDAGYVTKLYSGEWYSTLVACSFLAILIRVFSILRRQYITFQINHQPDATIFQFIILTFIYSSTCFGRIPAHHQELNDCSSSLWFYLRIVVTVVLCLWSGRPAWPWTQHNCHHDTKVKP